jgi:NADPH-dependent ferric siderophore reductase
LPVISAIIESLPAKTNGIVCVEVPTEDDIHQIETKANLEFKWIVNQNVGSGTALYSLTKNQQFPKRKDGKRFAYVAGEFRMEKRRILLYIALESWKSREKCIRKLSR